MDNQPKASVWRRLTSFIKDYGQTVFTVGTLIFAVGGANATLQNLDQKAATWDEQRLQQVALAVQVKELTKTQTAQSEAILKLTDAVNTLSNNVARQEGAREAERKRR